MLNNVFNVIFHEKTADLKEVIVYKSVRDEEEKKRG